MGKEPVGGQPRPEPQAPRPLGCPLAVDKDEVFARPRKVGVRTQSSRFKSTCAASPTSQTAPGKSLPPWVSCSSCQGDSNALLPRSPWGGWLALCTEPGPRPCPPLLEPVHFQPPSEAQKGKALVQGPKESWPSLQVCPSPLCQQSTTGRCSTPICDFQKENKLVTRLEREEAPI